MLVWMSIDTILLDTIICFRVCLSILKHPVSISAWNRWNGLPGHCFWAFLMFPRYLTFIDLKNVIIKITYKLSVNKKRMNVGARWTDGHWTQEMSGWTYSRPVISQLSLYSCFNWLLLFNSLIMLESDPRPSLHLSWQQTMVSRFWIWSWWRTAYSR